MSFLKNLISVLPSIANIVVPLFSAKTNDYLQFSLGEKNDDSNVYFSKNNKGEIMAHNSSREPISLIFPAKNGAFGDTINLDATSSYPVTQMMVEHAKVSVPDFQIVNRGEPEALSANNQQNNKNVATVAASGKVPKNDETKIGSTIIAKLAGNDLSIQVTNPNKLEGIVTLEVSGEGNEPCRVFRNILNDGSASKMLVGNVDPTQMTFPGALADFKNSNKIFVSVSTQCSYDDKEQAGQSVVGSNTDADWEFLKKGRCLNG